jgi:hypothetical protein
MEHNEAKWRKSEGSCVTFHGGCLLLCASSWLVAEMIGEATLWLITWDVALLRDAYALWKVALVALQLVLRNGFWESTFRVSFEAKRLGLGASACLSIDNEILCLCTSQSAQKMVTVVTKRASWKTCLWVSITWVHLGMRRDISEWEKKDRTGHRALCACLMLIFIICEWAKFGANRMKIPFDINVRFSLDYGTDIWDGNSIWSRCAVFIGLWNWHLGSWNQ